jgi:hypothetical protein
MQARIDETHPLDHNVDVDRQLRAQIDEMVAFGRTRPSPSRR